MSAPPFRFIHAADLHLDLPCHGLHRASPAVTLALAHAPLTAWDALVQLTIDQNAAFLLLAGDICGGAERAVPAQLRFLEGLQRLSAHGVSTFMVLGDDDPAERWMSIHRWPEGVRCFGCQDVESVTLTTASGQVATIHGISHSTDRSQNCVARFRRGSAPGIHIGLLHSSVDTVEGAPCSIGDLRAAGMDYWALGHDHRHRQLSGGNPWVVYPGTLQGRSLTGDETGPKGAVVVTVADDVVSEVTHHALDDIRLMRTRVDVSTLADTSDVRRALDAAATRLRSESSNRLVVAACEVAGRAPAWMGAPPADALWDRLLEEQRQEQIGRDGLVWWDSLLDMTERGEVRTHPDISVHIHQLVDAWRRAPAGLERLLTDQGVPLGAPAVFVDHSTLDPIEVGGLLTRAERVALSTLEREQP